VTVMEPIAKADPLKDPDVRFALKFAQDEGDDAVALLEIALMELALIGLHDQRATIDRAVKGKSKDVTKFARAIAKMALSDPAKAELATSFLVSKQEWIEIPEYVRRDGTKVEEHRRRLPKKGDRSAEAMKELADIAAELEEAREYQASKEPSSRRDWIIDAIDSSLEGAYNQLERRNIFGAVENALSQNSIGNAVLATFSFFAEKTNKLKFAAQAIQAFGPVAGFQVAQAYFRYGGYDVPLKRVGDRVKTEFGDTLPEPGSQGRTRNALIEMLTKRLPSRDAHKSDANPPSEGFIIDKHGNVIAHAVGRGNDHYLPFNIKHLRQLRKEEGVEFVRRRMYGGPTIEDFHAAMMMGADRLTVVSNAGVFTVELSQRSHGIKMEHYQVLSRYEELLQGKSILNFDTYREALEGLQAEFPLHIRFHTPTKGEWATDHDRIRPRATLMDHMRNAIAVMSGKDPLEPTGTRNQWWSGLEPEVKGTTARMPGQGNKSIRDRYDEMIRQGMPREAALALYKSVYQYNNRGKSPAGLAWYDEELKKVRREKDARTAPSAERTTSFQPSSPERRTGLSDSVRTPSTGQYGQVETRVDPSKATAPKQARPVIPPKAQDMFDAFQLNPERVRPQDYDRLKKISESAMSMDDHRFKQFYGTNRSWIDEVFGN
jgi:hypothetical protein